MAKCAFREPPQRICGTPRVSVRERAGLSRRPRSHGEESAPTRRILLRREGRSDSALLARRCILKTWYNTNIKTKGDRTCQLFIVSRTRSAPPAVGGTEIVRFTSMAATPRMVSGLKTVTRPARRRAMARQARQRPARVGRVGRNCKGR